MASYSVARTTISHFSPTHVFHLIRFVFVNLLPSQSSVLHTTPHTSLYFSLNPYTSLYIHKMDATTQAQPLADRSTNTHLTNASDKTDLKASDISSMEYHRQVLQGKVTSEE